MIQRLRLNHLFTLEGQKSQIYKQNKKINVSSLLSKKTHKHSFSQFILCSTIITSIHHQHTQTLSNITFIITDPPLSIRHLQSATFNPSPSIRHRRNLQFRQSATFNSVNFNYTSLMTPSPSSNPSSRLHHFGFGYCFC